jgi:hypothetical protein
MERDDLKGLGLGEMVILIWVLKNHIGIRLECCGSLYGQVAGSFCHGPWVAIKGGNCIDWLRNDQPFNKDSAPRN